MKISNNQENITIVITTSNPEETYKVGEKIGGNLIKGDIVFLEGKPGAGKTCLAQGIAKGIGVSADNEVISPFYTILNVYKGLLPMYHFDLYRIDTIDEIINLPYEEYLFGSGVSVIEWPNRMVDLLIPEEYFTIEMSWIDENKRRIVIKNKNRRFDNLLNNMR